MVIGFFKHKEKMKAFKKYILLLAAAPMLWACSADEGSMPGTDSKAAVTIYTYAPAEGNPDNDVMVRFVTNNKTTSVKYLVAPTADIQDLSEKELVAKVEAEGKTVENLGGNSYADITITDLLGAYSIAAVANGSVLGNTATFTGLAWDVVKEGTFYYANNTAIAIAGVEAVEATLEVCTTDDKLYRINGVFGAGTALKMDLLDITGEDADGKYTFFRVKPTDTPWTYGDYGTVFVQDIGYWQGNASFVTDGGYESGLYENGSAFFYLAWCVNVGALGYDYSYFEPND